MQISGSHRRGTPHRRERSRRIPFRVVVADLPFNPLRLILLIGWVYLCMYFVQRANFSPLVPKGYKTVVNVVTLFTGPFLLLTLFLVDTARKTRETRESFFDVLKRQIQQAVMTVRSFRLGTEEDDSTPSTCWIPRDAASTRSTGTATSNGWTPRS